MVGPSDVKLKAGASVGYWVNYVTLTFDLTPDLDLGFFKAKFPNSWTSRIVIWLIWNEKKANQLDTGLTVWFCPLIRPMILSLKFQGQSLNSLISGMGGWIDMEKKGMWVDHPWPWPWPLGNHGEVDGCTWQWLGWLQTSAWCRHI